MGVLTDLELGLEVHRAWNGLLGPEQSARTPCTPGVKRPSTFLEDLRDLLDGELDWWGAHSTKTPNTDSGANNRPKNRRRDRRQVSFEDEDDLTKKSRQVSFEDEGDVVLVSQRSRGRLSSSQVSSSKKIRPSTQTQTEYVVTTELAEVPRDKGWSWPAPCCSVIKEKSSRRLTAPPPRRLETPHSERPMMHCTDSSPYLPPVIPEAFDGEWNPAYFRILSQDEQPVDLKAVDPWQHQMKQTRPM